jgi:predicted nucleic acid-binding protein
LTLVDTNVLIDVTDHTLHWFDWAQRELEAAALRGPVWINDIVYAEYSVRFASPEAVEAALEEAGINVLAIPRTALFLAGQAYFQYRRAGGTRTGVLPDFFIGAHAAVTGIPLLTRDAARYRTYFPTVELIVPDAN